MPIDYSKFEHIDDSDGEDDRARSATRGADFERLFQECLRQEAAEAAAGRSLAGGKFAEVGRGGLFAPPPPPPPPPCDLGMMDPMDPLDGYGYGYDDYAGLDDEFGASTALDMEALRIEAWRLLVNRLVTTPGTAAAMPRQLLLEAEVHMMASRYRPALVTALAIQLATAPEAPTAAAASAAAGASDQPYGEWTAPTMAVEMICSYQLGDRDRAVGLRDQLQNMDHSMFSAHLSKRFKGTSEVLDLVPQFMNLLKAAEQGRRDGEPAAR